MDDADVIAALFASPLVYTDRERRLREFPQLKLEQERDFLRQCVAAGGRELSFGTATHDQLLAAMMDRRCKCLHFSGSIVEPSCLTFEDGSGGPNWFKDDDIKRIFSRAHRHADLPLPSGSAPLQLVFLSSRGPSEIAGHAFAHAGVSHVLVCSPDQEQQRQAFTRQFYASLLEGRTVIDSFVDGLSGVREVDPDFDLRDYHLFPLDGRHDVSLFNPIAEPDIIIRQQPPPTTAVRHSWPKPPIGFLGRQKEMYCVWKMIHSKSVRRLVSIVAQEAGMGRSSLVRAVCQYGQERIDTTRNCPIDKIYYVSCGAHASREDGFRDLLLHLQFQSGHLLPSDILRTEDILDYLCHTLRTEKALVVFDRLECFDNQLEEFEMLLNALLERTRIAKVLLTCLGNSDLLEGDELRTFGGQMEHRFQLVPFTLCNTLKLFAIRCPHLKSAVAEEDFVKRLDNGDQSQLRLGDPKTDERTREIFGLVGDGIPSLIEHKAKTITFGALREMLERLGTPRVA